MLRPRVLLPTFSAASPHHAVSDAGSGISDKGHDRKKRSALINVLLVIALLALTLALIILHNTAEDAATFDTDSATIDAPPLAPDTPLSSLTSNTETEKIQNPLKDYRKGEACTGY